MVYLCSDPVTEISTLLSGARNIRIAVAYWGAKAVKRLNLKEIAGRDVQIICDLFSGGCNPKEIVGKR
jgi:hypothetical protein